MVTANGQPDIHLSIPSRLDYLYTLCGFFENLGSLCNFDDDTKGAVVTAVVEAATNAIQHGNKEIESKPVDITVDIRPEDLTVVVRDHGSGMGNAELTELDESLPEDIFAVRGRGIALMRALMDVVEFEWSDQGTTVRLVKHRVLADANPS